MDTCGLSTADEALLQAIEQHLHAQAKWRSVSQRDRSHFQQWHEGRQVSEADVPHELRFAFKALEECSQAREAVKSARSARDAAREVARRAADPRMAEMQKVRQIREAVHHLKRSVEDNPSDANTLAAALRHAQAVGASPQQIRCYEQTLKQWYDEQPFEVQISTVSAQRSFDISGAEQLGDFKSRVAKALDWKPTGTKLLLRGVHLRNDSKRLYDYEISPDNNMLVAVQTRDEVEDAHNGMAERWSCTLAEMKADLELVGIGDPWNSHSTERRTQRHWTFELIYEAVTRGVQDIPEAAQLILQVEDGELSDEDARRLVRANARSASGVFEPLADVDKSFLDSADERLTQISDQHRKLETHKRGAVERRAYADLIARDARCWSLSTDKTGQARAIPKVP